MQCKLAAVLYTSADLRLNYSAFRMTAGIVLGVHNVKSCINCKEKGEYN